MSLDPPTVNENPTLVEVDRSHQNPFDLSDFPDVAALSAEDNGSIRTPEDLSVMKALADASIATHGRAVSMLKNVGLKIDERYRVPPSLIQSREPAMQEDKKPEALEADEIYEIIRNIQDPEHPLTLEELGVVSRKQVEVDDVLALPEEERTRPFSTVKVRFTPTIPHCSMATQIGLCLKVKLDRSLPKRFKNSVMIEPGTHASENAINKQLADKERVCAALENKHLLKVVNRCIANGMNGELS